MSKLDLNSYNSTEIFDALIDIDLQKFLEVMTAMAKFSEATQRRGKVISDGKTKNDFEKFVAGMDGTE